MRVGGVCVRAQARVCVCLFVHANLRACECAIRGAASCLQSWIDCPRELDFGFEDQ
jgi:hypothetical protein